MDRIDLSLFASRIKAVCDEMGAVLMRTAFSPNIKDRLDFSCALFDRNGELCAQAAHIPVHLGSMAYAMREIVGRLHWKPDDMLIVNDPYLGGTHLPDVTLIAPVFVSDQLAGFVANRAHHADIGSETPGSMPISSSLEEEGLVIEPVFLYREGIRDQAVFQRLYDALADPEESMGDFNAQISANRLGARRLHELIGGIGMQSWTNGLEEINEYAERIATDVLGRIPAGEYTFTDCMDDDGLGAEDVVIKVRLVSTGDRIEVDFSGTSAQVTGNINCPLSVTAAAVYYVFRCLMPAETPAAAGSFRPVQLTAPEGCLLNAKAPAAVAAGNVETSTRIVDVLLGALAQAIPDRIPAASHGSMNNLAMGLRRPGASWSYYETVGGGMGASNRAPGLSAVQTHMTNTLNTPVEVLEQKYPLRVVQYRIRTGSGGNGAHRGGDGIVREYEFLSPAQVTLLTERRRHAPWGLAGGEAGQTGINCLNNKELPGKISMPVETGDRLTIETPGGGGYGKAG